MDSKALINKAEQGDEKSQLALGQVLLIEGYPDNISDAAVHWLEKASFAKQERISMSAVKELMQVYVLYRGIDAQMLLNRLVKLRVRKKNPLALFELGRIYYGDETSPFVQRFHNELSHSSKNFIIKGRLDLIKEDGFFYMLTAADTALNLGKANPFGSKHYYILAETCVAEAKAARHYYGQNHQDFQKLLSKQLQYSKLAYDWAKENDMDHVSECKALLAHAQKLKQDYAPKKG